jgi:hypothetical protein
VYHKCKTGILLFIFKSCNLCLCWILLRLQQQRLASFTVLAVYSISMFVFFPNLLALLVFARVLKLAFSKANLRFRHRSKSYIFPDAYKSHRQQTFSLRSTRNSCGSNVAKHGSHESHTL